MFLGSGGGVDRGAVVLARVSDKSIQMQNIMHSSDN